jgi:hypothetical protein
MTWLALHEQLAAGFVAGFLCGAVTEILRGRKIS